MLERSGASVDVGGVGGGLTSLAKGESPARIPSKENFEPAHNGAVYIWFPIFWRSRSNFFMSPRTGV
jgi:hypothetical protein